MLRGAEGGSTVIQEQQKKLNHFCHHACVTTINVNNHGIDVPSLSTVFYVSANQPFPDLQPAVVQSFTRSANAAVEGSNDPAAALSCCESIRVAGFKWRGYICLKLGDNDHSPLKMARG